MSFNSLIWHLRTTLCRRQYTFDTHILIQFDLIDFFTCTHTHFDLLTCTNTSFHVFNVSFSIPVVVFIPFVFSQIVNVDIVAIDLVSYNVKFVNNNCNIICFSDATQ
jgi:hypothetical protein